MLNECYAISENIVTKVNKYKNVSNTAYYMF